MAETEMTQVKLCNHVLTRLIEIKKDYNHSLHWRELNDSRSAVEEVWRNASTEMVLGMAHSTVARVDDLMTTLQGKK